MSVPGSSLEKGPRLWAIAQKFLAPERSYTHDHVKTKLETYLKVSPVRAAEGFSLMVTHGVLVPTHSEPPRYYLGDTTPF
jgi:hypothetical protein